MKNKHITTLIFTLLLAVTIYIILQNLPKRSSEDQNTTDRQNLISLPTVEMKEAKYIPDYVTLARSRENPPFEFRGQGTSGKVVDRQGQVLMESGEEIGIFAAEVGPDKQLVLIKGGDSVSFILQPSTSLKLQLPIYPPGKNMFGFSWHWLGETKLIGLSGVQLLNAKGKPENSCGGNNVAQTKLYVYDITTQKLTEVGMPSSIKHSVVNVVEVINDGHLHLLYEDPHGKESKDLGWFKIE
jgi:hypothetical protein